MVVKGFYLVCLVILVSLPLINAINLDVNPIPIRDTIINDNKDPIIFEFEIINKGDSGNFEIFSFERFRIEPSDFFLANGDSTNRIVKFFPEGSMQENIGALKVPIYFREGSGSETIQEDIFVKLVDFDNAFDLKAENINPESDSLTITFYNVEDIPYGNIDVVFSSDFFKEYKVSLGLDSYGKKVFSIPINKEDFKKLVSGTYFISATYTIDGRIGVVKSPVKLLEKSNLVISEETKGFIIHSKSVDKYNEGNIPTIADVAIRKNIISRLFTTFSVEPLRVERQGIYVDYFWQKELQPDETLSVKVTTNWIFPLLILIGIILILYLFNLYNTTNVVVRKNVSFVKTKGGEFALKVNLRLKAKKFVDKVTLIDRLPAMAQLYEKFGNSPSKVNKVSGRLEWDVGHLGEGEERFFSYVIYSKTKIVGKFELPSATLVYELDGKLHEIRSNRAFFINEPVDFSQED